jgi:hypothetical protein
MATGSPFNVTCDRCGTESPPSVKGPGDAMAQGWSRFEQLGEDGDAVHFVTLCPECVTEGEEAGLWPTPSSSSRGGRGNLVVASEELPLVSWGNAGSTYYAVVEGRIVGLLYFEGEGLGEEDNPDVPLHFLTGPRARSRRATGAHPRLVARSGAG